MVSSLSRTQDVVGPSTAILLIFEQILSLNIFRENSNVSTHVIEKSVLVVVLDVYRMLMHVDPAPFRIE